MRAPLLLLVVGITSVAACGGGEFAARDGGAAELGGQGSGAEESGGQGAGPGGGPADTGGQGGGTQTGGATGHGGGPTGGASGCTSASECPVTDSCHTCWDGSCVSSTAACVNGQCVVTPGVCPRNPCDGVGCGGTCDLCGASTVCQIGYCDGAGTCVATMPRCACDPNTPCPQPPDSACTVCANGTTVCSRVVCYNGQCQPARARCPCEAMQAVGSGTCSQALGVAWNGSACVTVFGCECTGADCPTLFSDVTTCKDKQSQCPVATNP